jgi:hypothetical protein
MNKEFFTLAECSHIHNIIVDDDITCNIGKFSGDTVRQHSRIFNYDLFYLLDKPGQYSEEEIEEEKEEEPIKQLGFKESDKYKFVSYGPDFLNNLKSVVASSGDDQGEFFYIFTDKAIKSILKSTSTKIDVYFTKRLFFPNNNSVREKCTKKIEYEFFYILNKKISKHCVMNFQVNVLNFKVDGMVELKNPYNSNIPAIYLDANEDGHRSYDKLKQEDRQKVIEYFGNNLINIDIPKNISDFNMEKLADKTADIVYNLHRDLVIDYTPKISDEDIFKLASRRGVERDFIPVFLNGIGGSPYEKYKFCHIDIAKHLGYSINMKRFIELIKKIDPRNYIVKTRKELRQDIVVGNQKLRDVDVPELLITDNYILS